VNTESNPITDLELVRHMDGELEPSERSALDSRLANTPHAADRLEQLRRRSRNMSALLRTGDASGADTRRSADAIRPTMSARAVRFGWPPYLKAAAAVALLLTAAFAVPPARAWLLARLLDAGRAVGLVAPPTPAAVSAPPKPAVVSTAEVSYSFSVSSDTFAVEMTQNAGELVVQRSGADSATAEAAGASGASFLLLPRGLRIEGPAAQAAVYTITLPERVSVLRLQRGAAVSWHSLRLDQPLRVDLSAR
jgi:anti-sigma factor RsiW